MYRWCHLHTHLVHEGQHLQCEHVLSEVITVFRNHFNGSLGEHSRVHVLKLQPQRGLQNRVVTIMGQSCDLSQSFCS